MSLPPQQIKIPGVKTVIGIISGKGGVGKTFVASSLASLLAKQGKRVGLLDADICCPNIFKILGVTGKLALTAENKLMPLEKYGIKVISMAGLCSQEDEPIIWRGPIISKIIQQLLKETLWGELDFLIIDFPTETSDAALTILKQFAVNGVIIVTAPQELAMLDARRTINMVRMLDMPIIGIVENMRGEVFGEGGGNKIAASYGLPMLTSIPMRKQITTLCDEGIPPVLHSEELEMLFSKITRAILEKVMIE